MGTIREALDKLHEDLASVNQAENADLYDDWAKEDEDDIENYEEDDPITPEQEAFANELRAFLQSLIDEEEQDSARLEEKFTSQQSLIKRFNKHCLANTPNRTSTKSNIYYDFTSVKQYSKYEQKLYNIFRQGVSNSKERYDFIDDIFNVNDVNKKFTKLFEGNFTLFISGIFGLRNSKGTVNLGIHAFSSDVTTNYRGGNTLDICILSPSLKSITLYPVDATTIKGEIIRIINKYSSLKLIPSKDDKQLLDSLNNNKTRRLTEGVSDDDISAYLDKLNVKSNGVYSINYGWIKHPVQQDIPEINKEEFEKQFKVWEDRYFDLLNKESSREKIDNLIEDVYNLRKEGMEEEGEYSTKNLIFKEFRNLGYLDNLKELRKKEISKELSLENLQESKEDIQSFVDKFGQDTYAEFQKSSQRLKNNGFSTDLTKYTKETSKKELDRILFTLKYGILTKDDSLDPAGDFKYFGDVGEYSVYQPLDYIASMNLGAGTRWCISGRFEVLGERHNRPSIKEAKRHWEEYTNQGAKFIFLIDKKTHLAKWALTFYPTPIKKNTAKGVVESNMVPYDEEDDIDYEGAFRLPLKSIVKVASLPDITFRILPDFEDDDLYSLDEEVDNSKGLIGTHPYMLRQDGKLLDCGNYHPYIKMYQEGSYEENLENLLYTHPDTLLWFYKESNNNKVESLIQEFLYALEENNFESAYKKEIKDNLLSLISEIGLKETNRTDKDIFEELDSLTKSLFCKVRTSNWKFNYGGENGQIYFRIPLENLTNFNWFDPIWRVCMQFKNTLKYVTIMCDSQSYSDFTYYKVKGQEIKNYPIQDFLILEGDIVLESLKEGREAPLYHGTSVKNLLDIISSNMLKTGRLFYKDVKAKRKTGGVSLTRSKEFAKSFGKEVVFTLDQSLLTNNYKLIPTGDNANLFKTGGARRLDQSKAEEEIYSDIAPLSKYLIQIDIYVPMNEEDKKIVSDYCNSYKIKLILN